MFLFRSYKLFEAFGIPIRVHGSLIAFLLLFSFLSGMGAGGVAGVLLYLAFYVLAFSFVLLHELGHSLTALALGIPVRQITLYPIGGIAGIEHLPKNPRIELLVTIAGPAVNISLAGIFGILYAFWPGAFLFQLLVINLILGVFNLLPGFPMDGGRILRALLAYRMPYLKATEIAVRVGRTTAIAMGIFGLVTFHFLLVLVALFIYQAAGGELLRLRMEESGQRDFRSLNDLLGALMRESRQSGRAPESFATGDRDARSAPRDPGRVFRWMAENPPRPTREPRGESGGKSRTIEILPDGRIIDVS